MLVYPLLNHHNTYTDLKISGLTMLLPHLLSLHRRWRKAKLRLMSVTVNSALDKQVRSITSRSLSLSLSCFCKALLAFAIKHSLTLGSFLTFPAHQHDACDEEVAHRRRASGG
jgi:hypothetical protein